MDEKRAGQDWRQSEVEGVRRLLEAHPRLDSKRPPTAAADQVAEEANSSVRRPLGSVFEADQPDPASAIAAPRPAGTPQLVGASPTPQRRPKAWLLLVLSLTLVVGLGAGFALGARWTGGSLPRAQTPVPPVTQPAPVPQTSIVVRRAATSACLEAAKRGDELIGLLISNKRSRAAKLLVPYHVASRQCARDGGP
jgi:hypothetical protein